MLRELTGSEPPRRVCAPRGHNWPPFRGKLRQAWLAEHAEYDGGGVLTWRSFGLNGTQKNGVSPNAGQSPDLVSRGGRPALEFIAANSDTCDCGALGSHPVLPSDGSDYVFVLVAESHTSLGMMFNQYVAGGAEFDGRTLSGSIGGAQLQFAPGNVSKPSIALREDFQVALWRSTSNNIDVMNSVVAGGDTIVDRGAAGPAPSNVGNVIGGRSASSAYGPATTQFADGVIGGVLVYNWLSDEQCRTLIQELGKRWDLL